MTTRVRPSSENLRITVVDERAEQWALAAVALLLERIPGKVYFLGREGAAYPHLSKVAHHSEGRFAVVEPGHEPSNFTESSRVVHDDGALWIVSARGRRFSTTEWQDFADRLCAAIQEQC